MNVLNDDVLNLIYRDLYKISILPELKRAFNSQILIDILKQPGKRTKSRLIYESNLPSICVNNFLKQNCRVSKKFSNIYNTVLYSYT